MLTIIIPVYNNLELNKKCLDSIRKNTKGDYEVIVVDDCSTDGSREYLEKQKDIVFIPNKNNLGFSKNNNLAAKKAKGDILVFLNNDTEVHANWLSEIAQTFRKEKNIGAVGVKLLFPGGNVQHAGVTISEDRVPRHIYYNVSSDKPYVNKERELTAVTAACVAISKKVFEEVGGFNEEYKNGLEDIDLCHRIREKGYKIIYNPKSVVTHHESVSEGRFEHNKHNSDLYISKWKNVESDEHKIYKEDGFSWFYILLMDLKHMAYSKNEYGTVPAWVRFVRIIYIPLQKTYTLIKLLLKGDFKKISSKLLGGKNEG